MYRRVPRISKISGVSEAETRRGKKEEHQTETINNVKQATGIILKL